MVNAEMPTDFERDGPAAPWRDRARPRPIAGVSSSPIRTPSRREGEGSDLAAAVLAGWQRAAFRGYAVIERRLERRLVVGSLLDGLAAEPREWSVLLVAADEVSRAQWARHLDGETALPSRWAVLSAEQLLAGEGHVSSASIVIADELETFLRERSVAAFASAGAVLGLCGSPRGLGDAAPFRRYVGRPIADTGTSPKLDLSILFEQLTQDPVNPDESAEPREQLLMVNDPGDLLSLYLTQTQKHPLLSADEEVQLARQVEAGVLASARLAELRDQPGTSVSARRDLHRLVRLGETAMDRFLVSNLRLVYSVARRYSRRIDIMDAIQEGNLGLIRAVQKFDHTKGYKFSTYATWWIRQAISRAISDQAYTIRVPVHLHESDALVVKEWRRRVAEGEDASALHIAIALKLQPDSVEAVLRRHRPPYSLDHMLEEGIEIIDEYADSADERVTRELLQKQLRRVLHTLSEREAGVIRLRYGLVDGDEKTLDEIGRVYGVTRERIRQIESKTMSKLRHHTRSHSLRDFANVTSRSRATSDDSQEPAESKVAKADTE